MRVLPLSEVRRHHLSLTAHESVAIVHEVCRLMHESAQHGRSLPAPSLKELFVSESGELSIELDTRATIAPTQRSLTELIDELMPADMTDNAGFPLSEPVKSSVNAGDHNRVVLQSLFARLQRALGAVVLETTSADALPPAPVAAATIVANAVAADADSPGILFDGVEPAIADDVLKHANGFLDPLDGSSYVSGRAEPAWASVATGTDDVAVAAVALADDGAPVTHVADGDAPLRHGGEPGASPASPSRPTGGWERSAVLWGVALNVALGLLILRDLGMRSATVGDFVRRSAGEVQLRAAEFTPPRGADEKVGVHAGIPHEAAPLQSARIDAAPATLSQTTAAADAVVPTLEQTPARGSWTIETLPSAVGESERRASVNVEGADHATVSPDGQLVAFDLDRDGERGVFIAHRDGTDLTLASGTGRAAAPSWSPDMARLAFVRAEPDRPEVWNLWVRDLRSGELRRLTSHEGGIVRGASWFPDARRLCYTHDRELRVLDVSTGRESLVKSPLGRPMRTASVSPDGRRIAFEIEGDGIWILNVGPGSMERVIDEPMASELTWGAEGRRLTYYSLRARQWRAWVTAPRS